MVGSLGGEASDTDDGRDGWEGTDPGHAGELRAKRIDDFSSGGSLGTRLQPDADPPRISRRRGTARSDAGGESFNVRIGEENIRQLLLVLRHGGKRGVLRSFGNDGNLTDVFCRDKAFRQ